MDDELRAFLDAGADLVLTKPMKPWMLDQLLIFFATHGVLSRAHEQECLWLDETAAQRGDTTAAVRWGRRK